MEAKEALEFISKVYKFGTPVNRHHETVTLNIEFDSEDLSTVRVFGSYKTYGVVLEDTEVFYYIEHLKYLKKFYDRHKNKFEINFFPFKYGGLYFLGIDIQFNGTKLRGDFTSLRPALELVDAVATSFDEKMNITEELREIVDTKEKHKKKI